VRILNYDLCGVIKAHLDAEDPKIKNNLPDRDLAYGCFENPQITERLCRM
jgi:hypothetical protein